MIQKKYRFPQNVSDGHTDRQFSNYRVFSQLKIIVFALCLFTMVRRTKDFHQGNIIHFTIRII